MPTLKNFSCRHLSHRLKCHFFIANTKKVSRNKMIAINFKNFKIKVSNFINIKPPFFYRIRR